MADIIHLLPDNIANQIAAGEVIQRPASAVKELLENAIDAGATEIQLLIRDAGKELVQVIDNGGGMSETDARMSFERHATSKIQSVDDLFQIRTMGFRGEALASIAAVAQVELKTRKHNEEIGTYIEIDNSSVKKQEPCQCAAGTSFSMKNLFFNVPARRNFLKSNAAETRHIIDEFIHVAMAFPAVFFSLTANGQEIFHLEKGSLKQRIINIIGNHYHAKLVTVNENTDYLNIYGFVGKPETAKKTRGDQFFFVNNRFIRSPYLNHAVMNAFTDMIPTDSFPLYVLFIDLDPANLDINVHPAKQEIKFEDEKLIYAFVQAAVKHALAQFSVTPTLNFDLDPSIQQLPSISQPFTENKRQAVENSAIYKTFTQKGQAHFIEKSSNLKNWKDLYEGGGKTFRQEPSQQAEQPAIAPGLAGTGHAPLSEGVRQLADTTGTDDPAEQKAPVQIHGQYILLQIKSGFILIDQKAAHERILYERYRQALQDMPQLSQQSLFPQTLHLPPADTALLTDMLPDLKALGYELEPFGNNTFIIRGTPADTENGGDQAAIEGLLEQFKHFSNELKIDKREKLTRALAKQNAVAPGKMLTAKEMQQIVDELFACSQPNTSPTGKFTYLSFNLKDMEQMLGK